MRKDVTNRESCGLAAGGDAAPLALGDPGVEAQPLKAQRQAQQQPAPREPTQRLQPPQRLEVVGRAKEALSREQLVERHAEREHIGAAIELPSLELLG